MQFDVQTRLFKLVSCKPEDSDFRMMRRDRDALVKQTQKNTKQMFCAFNVSRHNFRPANAIES